MRLVREKNANPTILKITDIRLILLRWVSYINVTYVFLETGLLLLGYRFLRRICGFLKSSTLQNPENTTQQL